MMTTQKKILPAGGVCNSPVSSREVPWVQRLTGPLGLVTGTDSVLGYDDCYDSGTCHHDLRNYETIRNIAKNCHENRHPYPGASWLWNGKPTETAPRNQGRLANLRKRQDFAPCANFVASIMPCRNNSEKISPKFLESGQNRRTFAVANKLQRRVIANKRINKIIISKIKTQVPEGH